MGAKIEPNAPIGQFPMYLVPDETLKVIETEIGKALE